MTQPRQPFSFAQITATLTTALREGDRAINKLSIPGPRPVSPLLQVNGSWPQIGVQPESEPMTAFSVVEPEEAFSDPACSVCNGEGAVDGVRCVLCQAQEQVVQSME